MMRITILGWYGTETIGDRAILAGILRIFSEVFTKIEIQLGSLYPDFTQRSYIEDIAFYEEISNKRLVDLCVFDSLSPKKLRNAIKSSDLVIVGGGPLMDIIPMYMLDYAFKYAIRHNIKTAIIGCGWGPLNTEEFIKTACSLINHSDLTIFRDTISLNQALLHIDHGASSIKTITSSIDPAVFSANYFKASRNNPPSFPYIAVNFRDISKDQYGGSWIKNEELFEFLLRRLVTDYDMPVYLIPMHSYFIGGDDRDLLNRISMKIKNTNLKVYNDPPTLLHVMALFQEAVCSIGMRFHSVLLQTILNGNNYILDYTDSKNGKIVGLMNDLRMNDFYRNRYISLAHPNNDGFDITFDERFEVSNQLIRTYKSIYVKLIGDLCRND